MKYTNKLFTIFALLGLLLAVSCKKAKNDPKPDPEVPGAALSGTWAAIKDNAITAPSPEIAQSFADFTITFTPTANQVNYTTTGSGDNVVFPATGSFTVEASDNLTAAGGAQIVRSDQVPVQATITEAGMVLTLEFTINADASTGNDNARIAGITGDYTFVLDKQ